MSKIRPDYTSACADGRLPWNKSLRDQLRLLRAQQKPYMTLHQLALLAQTDASTISEFETGTRLNIQLQTLRKWVRALGCEVYIKIAPASKRHPGKDTFLLEGPALPSPPKLIRKGTGVGRWQAAEYRRLLGKTYVPPGRKQLPKGKVGRPRSRKMPACDPTNPFDFDDTSPPRPRGSPSPAVGTQRGPD